MQRSLYAFLTLFVTVLPRLPCAAQPVSVSEVRPLSWGGGAPIEGSDAALRFTGPAALFSPSAFPAEQARKRGRGRTLLTGMFIGAFMGAAVGLVLQKENDIDIPCIYGPCERMEEPSRRKVALQSAALGAVVGFVIAWYVSSDQHPVRTPPGLSVGVVPYPSTKPMLNLAYRF